MGFFLLRLDACLFLLMLLKRGLVRDPKCLRLFVFLKPKKALSLGYDLHRYNFTVSEMHIAIYEDAILTVAPDLAVETVLLILKDSAYLQVGGGSRRTDLRESMLWGGIARVRTQGTECNRRSRNICARVS